MNGYLVLDKPVGMSSAQAVARVKRVLSDAFGVQSKRNFSQHPVLTTQHLKIGHAGTLDPLASGVLPLALGEATKTVQWVMDSAKAYQFEVTWGEERATDDAEGEVTRTSEKRPTLEEIKAILPQFTGTILQTPPNYSAIKQAGERAYDRARSGENFELQAREVRVDSIEVTDVRCQVSEESKFSLATNHQPLATATFQVACGKGTYIRSLARDMGRVIGCFGYVSALRRVKVGRFGENDAISLENIEKMVHKGDLGFIKPVESVLDDILAYALTPAEAQRLRQGQLISSAQSFAHGTTVAATLTGKLVAMCEARGDSLKPIRVFNQ